MWRHKAEDQAPHQTNDQQHLRTPSQTQYHHNPQHVTLHSRVTNNNNLYQQPQQLTTTDSASLYLEASKPSLQASSNRASVSNPISPSHTISSRAMEHHHSSQYSTPPIFTTYSQQQQAYQHPPVLPPISTLTSYLPSSSHDQHVFATTNPLYGYTKDEDEVPSTLSHSSSLIRKTPPLEMHQDLLSAQHGVSTRNQFKTSQSAIARNMAMPSSSFQQPQHATHVATPSQPLMVVYNGQQHFQSTTTDNVAIEQPQQWYDHISTHELVHSSTSSTPPPSLIPSQQTLIIESTTKTLDFNNSSHNMDPSITDTNASLYATFSLKHTCSDTSTHVQSTSKTRHKSKRKSTSTLTNISSSIPQTNWTFHRAHTDSEASFTLNTDPNFTAPISKSQERISVACTECRKAKKRCSGGRPCDRCVSMGKQCKDEHTGKKRGRKKKDLSESADEKNSMSDSNRKHVKTSDSSIGTESLSSETTSSKTDTTSPLESKISNFENQERSWFQLPQNSEGEEEVPRNLSK
ncbi:hypothetical protein C9374_000653 [Naegleria lovaniensis]|uniref:Zn(2)-C6 fungal-type domain-containing protein n=1 Tax=Naegleria lovaniensis TaxID=51637 RepID=A0AA88GZF1_NAELO|nr:uncharacterized protein C9374_000653 [Naegleria lovaniensis]KAG2388489.1 hypothetical protein C9374_000653 [Naegleria lovaniensis]